MSWRKTKNGTKLSGLKPDKGHIGHQAAKMILLKDIETADSLAIKPKTYHSSRLMEAQDLAILYDEIQRGAEG